MNRFEARDYAVLSPETATSSLNDVLGIGQTDEDELYSAMDWLLERQGSIQKTLAGKHMSKGSLVLYDLTSTYFEGRTCPFGSPDIRRMTSPITCRSSLGSYAMLKDARLQWRCLRAIPDHDVRGSVGKGAEGV